MRGGRENNPLVSGLERRFPDIVGIFDNLALLAVRRVGVWRNHFDPKPASPVAFTDKRQPLGVGRNAGLLAVHDFDLGS